MTIRVSVSCFTIISTHDLIHHEFVNEVREIMRWWLIILIQEAIVRPLGLLKGLDRYIIVLQDDFLKDLVQHLLLQTENRLTARHADCLINDKCTLLTQQNLLEVHASEILFVSHVIRRNEMEKLASA